MNDVLKEQHEGKSEAGFTDMSFYFSQAFIAQVDIIYPNYGLDIVAFHFEQFVQYQNAADMVVVIQQDCL